MNETLFRVLLNAMLAVLGAFARQLQKTNLKSIKLPRFFSDSFIAAFSGALVYFITTALKLDSNLAFAIAGIGGWMGPQILDYIEKIVLKTANIEIIKDKGEKEEEG